MLFDPNIDSLEDVIAIRAKAITALKQGQATVSWQNEGSAETLAWTLPVSVVLEETKIYLKIVDPALYGRRVTRTTPLYIR
jgi:hypothetical protein